MDFKHQLRVGSSALISRFYSEDDGARGRDMSKKKEESEVH